MTLWRHASPHPATFKVIPGRVQVMPGSAVPGRNRVVTGHPSHLQLQNYLILILRTILILSPPSDYFRSSDSMFLFTDTVHVTNFYGTMILTIDSNCLRSNKVNIVHRLVRFRLSSKVRMRFFSFEYIVSLEPRSFWYAISSNTTDSSAATSCTACWSCCDVDVSA